MRTARELARQAALERICRPSTETIVGTAQDIARAALAKAKDERQER